MRVGSEALLDGFSGVRRCTQEGRAAMSLDMSAVDKGLRAVAPPSALAPLRLVSGGTLMNGDARLQTPPHAACNSGNADSRPLVDASVQGFAAV